MTIVTESRLHYRLSEQQSKRRDGSPYLLNKVHEHHRYLYIVQKTNKKKRKFIASFSSGWQQLTLGRTSQHLNDNEEKMRVHFFSEEGGARSSLMMIGGHRWKFFY